MNITREGIAQLYMDHVYKWYGLSMKIISDRDPRFTSHFGRSLARRLGIEQNLSMAFHPQTNGLSEQKNQWVEQYLRLVTSMSPEAWTDWISIATAVHNNRQNATTKLSPNQILLGYEMKLIPTGTGESTNEAMEQRLEMMIEKRLAAIDAVRMPLGLRSERHPFACDRVVFSFVCFPYLSLPRIASYPANNPSSCDTGHTNWLSVPIMSLPAPSLLSFLLFLLSLLPLGQHLQTQRCYHAAISTLPFYIF